jgi:hypothetical protein
MAEFYVVENGLLVSHGFAQDGCEALQAKPGQTVVIGSVPGYAQEAVPYVGARWEIEKRCWVDGRSDEERAMQAQEGVMVARRAAYPPLEDLADALYWQAMGDDSKMRDYMTRCCTVKTIFPRI